MDKTNRASCEQFCERQVENPHAATGSSRASAAIDHTLAGTQDEPASTTHTPAEATSVSTALSQTETNPAHAATLQVEAAPKGTTFAQAETPLANTALPQLTTVAAQAAFSQAKDALAHVGLSLSACDVAALEADRAAALAQSGRLEFGAPPIGAIAEELAASPFLLQENALDTLAETQACFYRLRDDIDLSFTDEELAWALAQRFDAVEGDLEAVCATEAANVIALLGGLDQQVDQAECPNDEYRIVDDAGTEYVFRPQEWDYDEYAPGWDNEKWSDDFDE